MNLPATDQRQATAAVSPVTGRQMAEEVRRHMMQIRASVPGMADVEIHRDSLLQAAQALAFTVADLEAGIVAWADDVSGSSDQGRYDQALALWLKGESERALELAVACAVEAAGRAKATATEETPSFSARAAAAEERKAWLLAGHIEYSRGRLDEALTASRRALTVALYGESPLTWVEAATQVAWILDEQGNYREAEPMLRNILRVLERTAGPESAEVAASLNNLARLLRDTDRLQEAEILYRRSLAIAEAACGARHPQVAICLNNLAGLLRTMNGHAEAEPLLRRAIEIDRTVYGPDHAAVALGLNHLGSLLHALERAAEAEQCFLEALKIDEQASAPDSATLSADLANLAVVLHSQKRHGEAEPLLRRSISLVEKSHGTGHPRVAFGLTHLSVLLCDMDRHQEGGALARQAMKMAMGIARRRGYPAPETRFVGRAYRRLLQRLDIPDGEMKTILHMIKNELDQESGAPVPPSPLWLQAVLEEMGLGESGR